MAAIEALKRFFNDPAKTLGLSLALGALFALLTALLCLDSYRDVAACYGYYAGAFGRGEFLSSLHQGLPPLPIALPGLLCLLGVKPLMATELVSGLLYVLAALPLYYMLKNFLEPRHAAWGSLLYILAPKIMRFGCSGLPEAYRNFFAILALAILFSSARDSKWWKALAFGASLAGLSLSRGEGIGLAAFLGLMFAFFLFRRERLKGASALKSALIPSKEIALAVLALLLLISPRCYQNYLSCGYPVPDSRIGQLIQSHLGGGVSADAKKAEEAPKAKPGKKPKEDNRSFSSQFGANFRGAYEFYAIAALLGGVVAAWRRQWRIEYNWLLATLLVNVALFATISISYRYYLINLLLLMPLTVIGFAWALETLQRFKIPSSLVAAGLLAIALAQGSNGMERAFSRKSAFEKETAQWIEANSADFGHSGKGGLIKILAGYRELCLWIPYEAANPYGVTLDLKTADNFDLAIFKSPSNGGSSEEIEAMAARKDLERLSNPHSDKAAIFKKLPAKP